MTNILFIHNNFPAQFQHLARNLARRADIKVAAIGSPTARAMGGVKLLKYHVGDPDVSATHPFARRFDLECRRAEQVLYAASSLTASGFSPDIVIGHPGWGETLPLPAIFPQARLITYCEFFYRVTGGDLDFDPEFPQAGVDTHVGLHLKNAATLLALDASHAAISPTHWQRSTYPTQYQNKISVIHDGIDTDKAKPNNKAEFMLPSGKVLTRADEVITYVSRSFEPLRGFHILMRALPRILKARPTAQVLIMGGVGTPYGIAPPAGASWKSVFIQEAAGRLDLSRIHFTGALSYRDYLSALQISRAHVYLTYPFVLSWSPLEALSTECVVIASDTPPVREVINKDNGILFPFFDADALAENTIDVLARPHRFAKLRKAARATILDRYDLRRVCLPQLLAFLNLDSTGLSHEEKDDDLADTGSAA